PCVDAAAVPPACEVAQDRAADDVEHAPLPLAVALDAEAAALPPSDVAAHDGADQRHVPRPRQRGVGDAPAFLGGPVAGDDAVPDHQVRVAHPDAAPGAVDDAVADGQALEGDTDRAGGDPQHVEHPIDPLAVDDRGPRAGAPDQGAAA